MCPDVDAMFQIEYSQSVLVKVHQDKEMGDLKRIRTRTRTRTRTRSKCKSLGIGEPPGNVLTWDPLYRINLHGSVDYWFDYKLEGSGSEIISS